MGCGCKFLRFPEVFWGKQTWLENRPFTSMIFPTSFMASWGFSRFRRFFPATFDSRKLGETGVTRNDGLADFGPPRNPKLGTTVPKILDEYWLVVWNIVYFPFHIWDVILPIDELHHFSRWLLHHQPDYY